MEKLSISKYNFLEKLGFSEKNLGCFTGKRWTGSSQGAFSVNPTNNEKICYTSFTNFEEYEETIQNMLKVKNSWMSYPMVKRGEIIREIGDILRENLTELGSIISLEVGKIDKEGVGEVQEIIDICDYAVGLGRILSGKIIQSERSEHVLYENWNPLGLIGVITAFNFPCAVLGWNAVIGLLCGNLIVVKGAETTSMSSIAIIKMFNKVLSKYNFEGVITLVSGRGDLIGEKMINDKRLSLISFTGSTQIGRHVSVKVNGRFGRCILELGGNNGVIVMDDADLSNAIPQIVFGAVGTCGQRCTSIRRIMVHEKIYDEVIRRLIASYKSINIGDPLKNDVFCGPLHTKQGIAKYEKSISDSLKQGGKILVGGKVIKNGELSKGNFVEPTIIEIDLGAEIVQEEAFAPIVYINKIKSFEEGVKYNNSVPQGLSSSVFTNRLSDVQKWMGPLGADSGLINVNCGTSGAEIGGAFGGEKETGSGRESGGDAWRYYMRQSYSCINYGNQVQLAQGIVFPKF